jgi:crotonobetainyl-CoA:carnitine CoA-transferase CaiB-like acyl-CoA transferase
MVLADFGAEVIKIEEPKRGDYSRHVPPYYGGRESVYFQNVNRGKRSMTLNLAEERGRDIFCKLATTADVVIESFRPGVTKELGIDYAKVSELNPRIVYCSVTGFGQTGPYKDFVAHDLNIQGLSGLLKLALSGNEAPRMPGLQAADFAAAAGACIGILLGLQYRQRTGRGLYVDIAMLDCLISWLVVAAADILASMRGERAAPRIEVWGANPRYGIYRTGDGGYVTVAALERKFWERLCEFGGRADLIDPEEGDDRRLTDHGSSKEAYRTFLEQFSAGMGQGEWLELQRVGVPVAPVYSVEEALRDAHVIERRMVEWTAHPEVGLIPLLGIPFKLTPGAGRIERPAPSLGEHTDDILRSLGYSSLEIDEMRRKGVV